MEADFSNLPKFSPKGHPAKKIETELHVTTTARGATRGDRWQIHIQHAVGGGIPDKVVDDALERGASLGDRGVVASANVELVVILCEVARSAGKRCSTQRCADGCAKMSD